MEYLVINDYQAKPVLATKLTLAANKRTLPNDSLCLNYAPNSFDNIQLKQLSSNSKPYAL